MRIEPVDLNQAASALQAAFPDLGPLGPLRVLGEGFSSLAVETPTGIVFRIARTAPAGERYAREFQALPQLKPYLPVAIPEPRWYLPQSDGLPFAVIGYPRLPGRPLDFDDFKSSRQRSQYAEQMAAILAALHTAPADGFNVLDHWPVLFEQWRQERKIAIPALRQSLTGEEYRKVASWWEQFLADESLLRYNPVLVHGDFWFGNLLVEDERITGLLDFENLAFGDPALDFVPLLYLGESFYREVLRIYIEKTGPVGDAFAHRLRQLWAVREFGGLAYAIRYDDRVEFEESVEKIRKGPILSPAGLDGWGKAYP